jgi:quinoprotein glucose dehydrogenase
VILAYVLKSSPINIWRPSTSRFETRDSTLRAYDKKTGKVVGEAGLPRNATAAPMTYMINGKQYIIVATGGSNMPAALIVLSLP